MIFRMYAASITVICRICIFIAVLCLTYLLLFRFVQYNYYLIGGISFIFFFFLQWFHLLLCTIAF